jgi:excisionase family DNA binding protein
MKEKRFYKVSEAAEVLGFKDRGSIRQRIHDGRIKAVKNDGRNGHYLIPVNELENYIKTLEV